MSKARLIVAEVEGVDSAVIADAIRNLLGASRPADPPPIPAAPSAAPALPAADSASLAAQDAPAPPKAPRAARAVRKAKRSSAPSPAARAEEKPVEDSGCVGACVAALAKGPLTSVEVIKKAGYSEGAVYVALKQLRTAGRVEMVADDGGVRKNKLVE